MSNYSAPQGVPSSSPLDTSKLDELRMLSDDECDMLAELIDIFLDDTPSRLIELASAIAQGDAEGTRQNGHALKSSCAQLGAAQLSEYCQQLESMGRSGDLTGAQQVMAVAQTEFERVKAAMLAVKGS